MTGPITTMLDIGWQEMMVIAIVAIVVIGPKELPGVLRGVGRSVTKLRKMAGEFRSQFDEALKEADLKDFKESADSLRETVSSLKGGFSPINTIKNEFVSAGETVAKPVPTPTPAPVIPPEAYVTPAAAPVAAAPAMASPYPNVPPPPPVSEPLAVVAETKASASKTIGPKGKARKTAEPIEPTAVALPAVKSPDVVKQAKSAGKGKLTARKSVPSKPAMNGAPSPDAVAAHASGTAAVAPKAPSSKVALTRIVAAKPASSKAQAAKAASGKPENGATAAKRTRAKAGVIA